MRASGYRLTLISLALALTLLTAPPCFAQENLGTAMGIPTTSPAVNWPRSFSLETLGTGRLYPNGPEFGLSTTAGGFGYTGTSRMSGVGLAERSLPTLLQDEISRPDVFYRSLSDNFSADRAATSSSLFSAASANQLRSGVQAGASSFGFSYSPAFAQPERILNVDAVLQDRPASPDAVLRTGL